ncbi:MAG: helix-turn-helix domain-containing protein [Oscillospiraceae bacterium]|nr:helix-turn-helix domain-containing protein [Oscillospiraceae bacterium]
MLNDNIKQLRKLNGKTQEEIAEVVGVSRQAYAKWERGEASPDVERCKMLADFYGTTLDALVGDCVKVEGVSMTPAPRGKHIWGVVTLNDRGQVVLPHEARATFGLRSGSRLVLLGDEEEGLALVPAELFEERLHTMQKLSSAENDN